MGETSGVAAYHRGPSGGALPLGVGDVGVDDVRPAGFVFHADRVASEVDGFECYRSALEELRAAGGDLAVMGDSYAAVEVSIGDRFTQLGSGLGS